jgi:hypothetical protein
VIKILVQATLPCRQAAQPGKDKSESLHLQKNPGPKQTTPSRRVSQPGVPGDEFPSPDKESAGQLEELKTTPLLKML